MNDWPDNDFDFNDEDLAMEGISDITKRIVDRLAWHRAAVAGEKPMTYETAECGYFKVRDRRGLNKHKAPIKRAFIACAIWCDENGVLRAELAGTSVPVDRIWPYCAKYPIPYETYKFWHDHERWPDEQKDAAA